MAYPTVTYTFVNGTRAKAGEVNTNFQDLINALSDGTKDLNVNDITCVDLTASGTATYDNLKADTLIIGATTLRNWRVVIDPIQVGGNTSLSASQSEAAGSIGYLTQNAYYDETDDRWEYISADEASMVQMDNGRIILNTAAAGSADAAVDWNQSATVWPNNTFQIGINASDPATGVTAGQLYFNSTNNVMRIYTNSGWDNIQGGSGVTGAQGATGADGITGSQGLPGGDQGNTGVQGVPGVTGVQGVTGLQGVQGAQGETGVQGETGLRGPTGYQGVTGATGKGETGLRGLPGATGSYAPIFYAYDDAGYIFLNASTYTAITLDTEVKKDSAYTHAADAADVSINVASDYEIIANSSWRFTGQSGADLTIETEMQIDEGPGFTGIPGSKSASYVYNKPDQAQQAQSSSIIKALAVNDKVRLAAKVIASNGVVYAYSVPRSVNFMIRDATAGEQGNTGFQGATGIQGLTGPTGKGETGLDGVTGVQGVTGVHGDTGVQGETGLQGETGVQGIQGIGGVGTAYYFHNDLSGVSGSLGPMESFLRTPSAGAEDDEAVSVSNANGATGVWIDDYITEATDPGRTVINPGVWDFEVWGYADSAAGGRIPQLRFDILSYATDGTETLLFSTDAQTVTATPTMYTIEYLQTAAIAINATDRLICRAWGVNNTALSTNVHFIYEGTERYSYVTSTVGSGVQGATGLQGQTGLQGPTGIQGETGVQGNTGVQGETGLQGQTGLQGPTGVQGETGVKGDKGETGVQGIQGIQGATGVQGIEAAVTGAVNFIMDGGDIAITGLQGHWMVPFDMTFYEWSILAGQTGSITLDLYKDTYANFPPTSADSMPGAGLEPKITDGVKGQTGIAGWSTASATNGDIIQVYCESVATIKQATLTLRFKKD